MAVQKKLVLLQNPSTQFNCFVNAAVQLLWVIVSVRDALLSTKIGEKYDGVTKTLVELFQTMTSACGEHGAVSTWTLRLALAAERRSAFAVGLLGDAGEVFELLLTCIAELDFTRTTELGIILEDGAACGKCCTQKLLQPMPYFEFSVSLTWLERELRQGAHFIPAVLAGANPCESSTCDGTVRPKLQKVLPQVFTVWLQAKLDRNTRRIIPSLIGKIPQTFAGTALIPGSSESWELVGMIVYSPGHYRAFVRPLDMTTRPPKRDTDFILANDDKKPELIGPWDKVVTRCRVELLLPTVLLYHRFTPKASSTPVDGAEAQQGAQQIAEQSSGTNGEMRGQESSEEEMGTEGTCMEYQLDQESDENAEGDDEMSADGQLDINLASFLAQLHGSMGGDGMDMDFLAALEASKATKADEDFKRAQDASLEDAGAVSRIVKELRSNSIGGDGMDMDFLAALEASKATKADEDFERALAVTETDFLAALEASKATKADEDFKRALAASLEDAGAVSKAEETPLQQQQQDAVKGEDKKLDDVKKWLLEASREAEQARHLSSDEATELSAAKSGHRRSTSAGVTCFPDTPQQNTRPLERTISAVAQRSPVQQSGVRRRPKSAGDSIARAAESAHIAQSAPPSTSHMEVAPAAGHQMGRQVGNSDQVCGTLKSSPLPPTMTQTEAAGPQYSSASSSTMGAQRSSASPAPQDQQSNCASGGRSTSAPEDSSAAAGECTPKLLMASCLALAALEEGLNAAAAIPGAVISRMPLAAGRAGNKLPTGPSTPVQMLRSTMRAGYEIAGGSLGVAQSLFRAVGLF